MADHLDESMLATDIADYLVNCGIPFREAHHKTGRVIRYSEENNVALSSIPLEVYQEIAPQFEEDLFDLFNFEQAVNRKNSIGGTGLQSVIKQIGIAKKKLQKLWDSKQYQFEAVFMRRWQEKTKPAEFWTKGTWTR